MRAGDYEAARSWDTYSRFAVLGLLILSALQFLSVAVVLGTLGQSEGDRLLPAASLILVATAIALAVANRKSGAPTWKHKLIVMLLASPAALSIVTP